MTKKCKLFLMSSVTYKGTTENEDSYIGVMRSFISKYPEIQKESDLYTHLNGNNVFYNESENIADVDQVSVLTAINMAREFSMCSVDNFAEPYTLPENEHSNVNISDCQAYLLYDSHAFFTIIYEIKINYGEDESPNELISLIFKDRKIFENINIQNFVDNCKVLAKKRIVDIIRESNVIIDSENIKFEDDNTLPFLIFPHAFVVDRNQFRNEESIHSIGKQHGIASSYKNCFFHPGWNYTIASGFPIEVFINLLQMTIRAQSFFFSLGYMKTYYTRELTKTINEKDTIAEFDVDTAEDVQLAFYDLLAKFNTYKNKLFPKYHIELCALLNRWHCDSDIDNIKSYIELDIQSKDRIHRSKIEKQNDRQNKALTFIALVQLISIYGAFADGNAIFASNTLLFLISTATWTVSLVIYLMVSKYFKWGAIFLAVTAIPLLWAFSKINPFNSWIQ